MDVILFILVILGPLAFLFFLAWLIQSGYKLFSGKSLLFLKDKGADLESILSERSSYYRKLDAHHQVVFRKRLRIYMNDKTFEGRKEQVVTQEMRVLTSAVAIQITMGLDDFLMDNFQKIIFYPQAYKSKVTGKYHKGEVNLGGIIVLSWPDFEAGFRKQDNLNLGLHEMAHALRFDQFKGDYDQFFADYFSKWSMIAQDEFKKVRDKTETTIFREYAGSNMNEFFAVTAEHFFENPAIFKAQLPVLYRHTCILLNQDPMQHNSGIGCRGNLMSEYNIVPEKELLSTTYNFLPLVILIGFLALEIFLYFEAEKDNRGTSMVLITTFTVVAGIILNLRMRKIIICSNAVVLRYLVSTYFSPLRILSFDHVVKAEMSKEEIPSDSGSVNVYAMELYYYDKGKIESSRLVASPRELRDIGRKLYEFKVPVRVIVPELKWE
ncbi:MAG: zinc-dependent peptidase [Bacteroidota bacterium]|nr:zinc-dependent peptidase [Bacteroidota bacterium]